MNLNSFIEGLKDVDEGTLLYLSGIYVIYGLYLLYYFSTSGRPVAHPDRELGRKHKGAEAERVEILDRLNSGSKVGELKADDDPRCLGCLGCFGGADVVDVEKEPLRLPLFPTPNREATVATISLSSGGLRAPLQVCESMRTVNEATACGEFVGDSFVCSSDRTMMQTKVELHDGILERLKDLVKNCTTPSPNEFTPVLQVDTWAVLKHSDEGVKLLRLPSDKLPVILHAEYAAGFLTITGLNLEDAAIFASAANASYTVKLNVFRFAKATKKKWTRGSSSRFSNTEEDVAILPFRVSWKDMKSVFIYATKKVHIGEDGQSVDAMSPAVRILDSLWKTVLRLWMPTISIWIFTIYNIRTLMMLSPYSPTKMFSSIPAVNGFYFLIFWTMVLRVSSDRFVEFVKYHVETLMGGLGQCLLAFYYGFKGLKGPHLEFPKYPVRQGLPAAPPPFRNPPDTPPRPRPLRSRTPHDKPQPAMVNSDEEVTSARSVEDPEWEWPAFEEFQDKYGKIELKKRTQKVPDDFSPFRAIYRRRKEQLWPDVVQVGLTCPLLIKIVQKFLPQNGDLHCLENPTLGGRDLFTVLDDIKNRIAEPATYGDTLLETSQEAGQDEGKGELHLKHLMRFMDKEYGDVSMRLRRMTEEKRVAWDMLWAFLTPGRKVVYTCDHSEEMLAAVVSKNNYSLIRKEWLFLIELDVWDYDSKSYRKCQIRRTILKFDDERPFSSLAVRPIEMAGVPEVLDEGFLANGKRFYELAVKDSHRFMHYSGAMFKLKDNKGCLQIVKENADGRVMIDLASFAKMNPGYPIGRARPPVVSLRGSIDPFSGRRITLGENDEGLVETNSSSEPIEVSDENLIFAPAIVYGFSFTLKEWGSFAISGFNEISFNTNAFDELVMEPDSKQLVYNLVGQYIATPVGPSQGLQRVDPISNKGEGCVFLCYGPPGTGKTLTAESVAENMHRPLWSLNVSELGSNSSALEKSLFKVLEISATWRAVVLLDEADCFLEKRTSSADLTRNAMAGVFLRFLEYYRGVLFLTTNRIGTFDNAFRSRISLFLHYPKLSVEHRERVWTTLLERARVMGITADFISKVAAEELNGREIRNAIHTAQMWAKSHGQTLDETHVRYVTRVLVSSLKTLSDTIKSSECD